MAEVVSSYRYLGTPFEEWDRWFQCELEQMIDMHSASIIVYDGNAPSDGLVRAAGSRGARLVWVRGGMAGNASMPFIENAPYCDLIIEPGELAAELDFGITNARRHEATLVDPMLLLDPDELLSKEAAAEALGLDPARPSALIQLGTGSNRDVFSLIDQIVTEIRKEDTQIAIAEWSTGAAMPPLWPDVTMLRGHPFGRYYNAFDFSVAAAGYNAFHDIIAAGLPTVFIANTHPSMDDQRARAQYAEDNQLALALDEARPEELSEMIAVLRSEKARDFLRKNCAIMKRKNGAATAAGLIDQLALASGFFTAEASSGEREPA